MNCRGILAGFLAARSGQGFLDTCLRRPPGWPILEALVITAVILLAILAVEALAALAARLLF
jgi:hypothetical protein